MLIIPGFQRKGLHMKKHETEFKVILKKNLKRREKDLHSILGYLGINSLRILILKEYKEGINHEEGKCNSMNECKLNDKNLKLIKVGREGEREERERYHIQSKSKL